MDKTLLSELISGSALALTFGGMTFFSVVMAPLVFRKLPFDVAGSFIRTVFPWYYLTMGGAATVALVAMLLGASIAAKWEIALTTLVIAGFIYAGQILMPRINEARDAEIAGDQRAGVRFRWLHRASALINAIQLVAVFSALLLVLA